MALLESKKLALGSQVPDFALLDPSGKKYTRDQLVGSKGLLIIFTCNHCPYAQAVWPRLIKLSAEIKQLGINTVAINPNINPDYPEDNSAAMKQKITEWKIPFPYLVDASQNTAREFDAVCTPDIYLIDQHKNLAYHGRVDDNWKDEAKVKRQELKEAAVAVASGKPIASGQQSSIGCSIKWLN